VTSVSSISPQAWCRDVLAAVSRSQVRGPEAGAMELLLTYFIQCDPTDAEFGERLVAFSSARPGVAGAAQLLAQAWRRRRSATPGRGLSLRDTLGAVGNLLDDYQAQAACVSVAGDRVQLQAFGRSGPLQLGTAELTHALAVRPARGGMGPSVPPGAAARYTDRLRRVGDELDRQPAQTYQLLLTRQTIVIEGAAGYHRVCAPATPGESDQPPALTCQELLRTLGTLLDECGAERAVIRLSPGSAEVISPSWRLEQRWSRDAIAAASALQQQLRAQPRERPLPVGGLRWSLRIVGAALDALGGGAFTITVGPDQVQIRSAAGYERTFDSRALQRRADLAPYCRGQVSARPAGEAS